MGGKLTHAPPDTGGGGGVIAAVLSAHSAGAPSSISEVEAHPENSSNGTMNSDISTI
ncbi:MAG TPA: hypothetical protein VIR63_06480 [Pontiella sp.]